MFWNYLSLFCNALTVVDRQLIMLLLQTPGGLLIVVYNAFIVPSDWSTWLPFVFSSFQQLILVIICFVFMCRERRARRVIAVDVSDDETSALLGAK